VNLLLIGLRGSGKTTIGRLLADRSGVAWPGGFLDLDDLTARHLGARSVGEAWAKHGEPAFRRAESEVLGSALGKDRQVIALGGGTPTSPGAAKLLEAERRAGRARIVYLRADPEVLRARLSAADMSNRPSLTGGDPLAEIEAVFARRDQAYLDLADDVVDVNAGSAERIADDIIRSLNPSS
jgi:shikimate kinase